MDKSDMSYGSSNIVYNCIDSSYLCMQISQMLNIMLLNLLNCRTSKIFTNLYFTVRTLIHKLYANWKFTLRYSLTNQAQSRLFIDYYGKLFYFGEVCGNGQIISYHLALENQPLLPNQLLVNLSIKISWPFVKQSEHVKSYYAADAVYSIMHVLANNCQGGSLQSHFY